MQLFAEKGDFSNKKRPKRDPKSGLGLLRDPGLPKRDPVGSSEVHGFLTKDDCFLFVRKVLLNSSDCCFWPYQAGAV